MIFFHIISKEWSSDLDILRINLYLETLDFALEL